MQTKLWIAMILGSAATYALRFGGLLAADLLPDSRILNRFLKILPGTILISLIGPELLAQGPRGLAAGAVTVLCMVGTKKPLFSMIAGVGAMFLFRQFGVLPVVFA